MGEKRGRAFKGENLSITHNWSKDAGCRRALAGGDKGPQCQLVMTKEAASMRKEKKLGKKCTT